MRDETLVLASGFAAFFSSSGRDKPVGDVAPFVSPSAVSVFDPYEPQLLLDGLRIVHPGDEPLVLDASESYAPGDKIASVTWDLGEEGEIEGMPVRPRFKMAD